MEVPIGQRFKILLDELNLTQSQLCRDLEVSTSGLSRIVNGLSIPVFDTVEKLYKTYPGINPHWLLTGQGAAKGMYSVSEEPPSRIAELEREVQHLNDKIQLLTELVASLKAQLQNAR